MTTAGIAVDVATNLAQVRERMAAAARRAGRSLDEVTLVAVTKTKPPALIRQAMAAGQLDFGENLVEEAWAKFLDPANPDAVGAAGAAFRLHLIGPIQSRKAALAVACRPILIHAVDRLKIARRLDRFAAEAGLAALDVLLEVNVSGEASKFGYSPESIWGEVEAILALPHVRIRGLMTVPPYDPDPEAARPHFAALRRLRDRLAARWPEADWRHLSMGMSHDFEVAIEEGATLVRVGTAIFGPR
ncbi:MAG: YggS family pyridoxal phosphate-dependent enzyme [Caldilineales bacterium]|nr:YggS family pyridoxal phosphate-dependent enzyme [Caldilineales bacterium]MDW8316241.1 YggS family pyridoxal phosphate-dependent enzyme [Anaerolineae bacterium]